MTTQSRRGFSLIELLLAIVVASVLGAAMMSFMVSFTKFQERSEAQRSARLVGRSAINVLVDGLRMIDPSWGIVSVSSTSITVRAPYAMGLVCASTLTSQTVSLVPVDSVLFSIDGYSGFAWRTSTGSYAPVSGGTLTVSSSFPSSCTSAGIQQQTAPASAPNQKTLVVTLTTPSGALTTPITVGTPVMLYRRLRFYFDMSNQAGLSGRTALWREYLDASPVSGSTDATELAAPFDATAGFRFYVSGSVSAQTAVPADLTTLRGFQFYLPGESDRTVRQRTAPEQADLTTAVFFLNTTS
jgi:prepilin-type N-terminal cleavage/methylation domain-containing protein